MPIAPREAARLERLKELCLLDSPPEAVYDDLVALAAQIAGTPSAVLTLIDADRQWFKARTGLAATQTPRDVAFCAWTIEGDQAFVVEDARRDPRFASNPLVLGAPHIAFYAGVPLALSSGERVGALAVLDRVARPADPAMLAGLQRLARQACALFELRVERQRHAETALRLAEAQAVAGVGSWELDLDSRVLRWSDEVYRIFGVAPQSFGASFDAFFDFVHPEDRERFMAHQQRAEADGGALDVRHRIVRADGSVRHVHERAQRILAAGTRGPRLVGTVQDVTLQAEAEEAARSGHERLALVADSLRLASHLGRLGAWEYHLPTQRLHLDPEVQAVFGLREDEELSLDEAFRFIDDDDREALRLDFERCCTLGITYDRVQRLRDRTGQQRWTRAIGQAYRDADGRIVRVRGAFQDITDQTRLSTDLHRLGRRLEVTLEHMGDAFYLLDAQWRVQYFNAAAERLLGLARAQILGREWSAALPRFADTELERQQRRASAERITTTFEFRQEPLWLEVHVFPADDGLAVHLRDVTLQRRLSEQLEQTQRLEALGQLTGGVAHDFNNLLTVIQGNAESLCERLPAGAREHALAEVVFGAAQRGADLTHRLLAFARRQTLAPRAVDLNRLLADLAPLLRRSLGEAVSVETLLATGLWTALVDTGQLENAVLNLAINARDAMPEGGRIVIETANAVLDDGYVASHPGLASGPYVLLTVSDTGSGIAPEHLLHIFEPFFTTKEPGRGTGLGLAMVYGFVKQSGGHVAVYSEPGHGTTVKLYLPRVREQAAAAPAEAPEAEIDGAGRLVLLVEDEPLVRAFGAAQLRRLGFRVLEADRATGALALLRRDPQIALLFTDVVMPGGCNGVELADAARALRPGLPVLFCSGYAESVVLQQGRSSLRAPLLAKPYRRADLVRKLHQALEGACEACP